MKLLDQFTTLRSPLAAETLAATASIAPKEGGRDARAFCENSSWRIL